MAKQIRRVGDLPEWFDLEKYAAAESLDVAGWYEQLSVRRGLHILLGWLDKESWQAMDTQEVVTQSDMRILEHVRATPIVDVAGDDMMRVHFYGGAMHELKSRQPLYALGVHLSTVRNFYRTERYIEREKRDYARKFFAQFDDNLEMPPKFPCTDWIDEPIDAFTDSNGWVRALNITVNMQLPDKVLIEQFERILNERRARMQSVGIPSESSRKHDLSGWHRFGVLPYLDLKIWEREEKVSIPNRVMADAIFPAGEGGEEVVRKTTAKLAFELVTEKRLEILASIAAHEIAEQNTG